MRVHRDFHFIMKNTLLLVSRRTALTVFLAAAAMFAAAGCTNVQVGPNTHGTYKMGELQVIAAADFSRVCEAAQVAMKDVAVFQTGDERKVIEAEFTGRDATDTRVTVKIKEVGKGQTSVKIRYGLKGDLAGAQRLYQALEKRL